MRRNYLMGLGQAKCWATANPHLEVAQGLPDHWLGVLIIYFLHRLACRARRRNTTIDMSSPCGQAPAKS